MKTLRQTFCLLLLLVAPQAWSADSFLVDAIREVESHGGKMPIGDKGLANGDWHMHRSAWNDVSERRRKRGLETWAYSNARTDRIARIYAHEYLLICQARFKNATGRSPSDAELYATWNIGARVFGKQYKWSLLQTPAFRRERAKQVANLAENFREQANAAKVKNELTGNIAKVES